MSTTNAQALDKATETVFKIGAVSRITNIPVDTLRIWERRYNVVVPIRSNNADRLYQTDDINRLTLLKMLVDRGHAIGTVAKLTNSELTKHLEIHDQNKMQTKQKTSGKAVNVVLIGDVLSLQVEHSNINNSSFTFSGLYRNENEFLEKNNDDDIDILIIEYPAIQEDHIESINTLFEKSGSKHLILIYGFTNSAAKKLLNKTNFTYIQAPVTVDHLQTELIHLIKEENFDRDNVSDIELSSKAPLRTYTNNQLIQLSSASSTIECECPQHLSSMILKLIQFEIYSAECVNRYKKDSELHQLLGNMTGHARSIMEQALTKIVQAENLSLK
jgi:MerR family transcriptional regulator, light-induced transcriptional regulator